MGRLEIWKMIYDNFLDEISEGDILSSDYKPPSSRIWYHFYDLYPLLPCEKVRLQESGE